MLNSQLYPLQFCPIFKDKIWGGQKIKNLLERDFSPLKQCGESWDISVVEGDISVVANGFLKNKSIVELTNLYKDDFLGNHVYKKYNGEFPLLIKILDANADLSIQVHPDNEIALKRHNSLGKTEMWYVLQADQNSRINVGFKNSLSKNEYLKHIDNKSIESVLNYENVQKGDVYYLPAGRIHYIGKGCLIAEIQQTSDITYRIYDFDRIDNNGQKRELHTELAADCIDFNAQDCYKTHYNLKTNESSKLVHCEYFKTNILLVEGLKSINYSHLDSFVILIVVEGSIEINYNTQSYFLNFSESILIPACIKNFEIKSTTSSAKVMEVWVD